MNLRNNRWFAAIAFALLVLTGAQTFGQGLNARLHHYQLIDMGTLGGPGSLPPNPGFLDINSRGLAIAFADTSIPDPYAPDCLQNCLVSHAITWQNGVQTDLGALPGGNNSSIAFWSNDRGAVAGGSENGLIDPLTGFPEFVAALWKGGKILDLGTLGGNVSVAFAINNPGQVVGAALNTIPDSDSNGLGLFPFPVATQTRAALWQNGVAHDLGTLGRGNDAAALLSNNRGQVAGISFTDTILNAKGVPTQDPFFWENGKMVDIGSFGGTFGFPFWMNNRGQVVGFSNLAGDQTNHAFLWDKKGGLKDLGLLPGGLFAHARRINDAGEIVGSSDSSNGFHAVLWKNGAIIDLGVLSADLCSFAQSINASGQIVGNSTPDCIQDGRGFLSENGGPIIDLQTLVLPGSNVTVTFPVDINNRGEIESIGVLSNGDTHAILLIPCDENHPYAAGCDYGTVDAATAAQVRPAQVAPPSAAATFARLSPAEKQARIRAFMARHHRTVGAWPRR